MKGLRKRKGKKKEKKTMDMNNSVGIAGVWVGCVRGSKGRWRRVKEG